MPILVPVNQLQPGMCVAFNVTNRYSTLLPHGTKLTQDHIESLIKRMPDGAVKIGDPLLDDIVEFEDNSRDHEVSLEVRRNISTVSSKINQTIRSGVGLTANNIAGMERSIEDMLQYLQENHKTTDF